MAYIAIKNSEHKGVYEEEGFDRSIFGTKGMSYRKFEHNELQQALDWANVKALKISNKKKSSKKESSIAEHSAINNSVAEIIADYKSQGFAGLCITTKSLGDIILKINRVAIFRCTGLRRFDIQKDSLTEHLNVALVNAKEEKELHPYRTPYPCDVTFEIVEFNNLSNITPLNSDFLSLDNFWVKEKASNIFENKQLTLSKIAQIEGNINDYCAPYNNFTLNNNEIISIQPLEFTIPSNTCYLGKHVRGSSNYFSKSIGLSEQNEILKAFNDTRISNISVTQIL